MKMPFEFDGVVRLTKVGTTYVLATVVLAVAAVNTGNNALYIGVSFMLGCLLLSGMASKGGLKHLELEILGIDETWAGSPCEGRIRVRNRSHLWNVCDVILTSESLSHPVLVGLIPRRAELEVAASFTFPRRGLAHVSVIDAYTRYPFGFVLKKRRVRVSSEVIVYPRILDGDFGPDIFQPEPGEQGSSSRAGQGSELHSFREYARGDSLRHIHWKKSASFGRWIMKQTEADTARSMHVIVDPYKPPGASSDDFERMVAEAATFVFQALRRDIDITLSLPRLSVRASESRGGSSIFRALALVEPVLEPVWQKRERHSIVFSVTGGRDDAKIA